MFDTYLTFLSGFSQPLPMARILISKARAISDLILRTLEDFVGKGLFTVELD